MVLIFFYFIYFISHSMHAMIVTLLYKDEFVVTHLEMIKGIKGHGYTDTLVIPIIENTPHEADLRDSMAAAMDKYPKATAVLVRRHGVYVWGLVNYFCFFFYIYNITFLILIFVLIFFFI